MKKRSVLIVSLIAFVVLAVSAIVVATTNHEEPVFTPYCVNGDCGSGSACILVHNIEPSGLLEDQAARDGIPQPPITGDFLQ